MSMRRFAGLELAADAMPDETTILKLRHLLEKHGLTAQMMNVINDTLAAQGLLLKGGTMVDATIIYAPPSTKNQDKQRDPEMHQTKEGNQWYSGIKIHVAADVNSGLAQEIGPPFVVSVDLLCHPWLGNGWCVTLTYFYSCGVTSINMPFCVADRIRWGGSPTLGRSNPIGNIA